MLKWLHFFQILALGCHGCSPWLNERILVALALPAHLTEYLLKMQSDVSNEGNHDPRSLRYSWPYTPHRMGLGNYILHGSPIHVLSVSPALPEIQSFGITKAHWQNPPFAFEYLEQCLLICFKMLMSQHSTRYTFTLLEVDFTNGQPARDFSLSENVLWVL